MGNNDRERMHSSSLSVGDKLIQLDIDQWSGRIFHETTFTVAKITKTRLVLDGNGFERRVLIDSDGWVKNRFEGSSYTHVRLYTPDDSKLDEHRERTRVEELREAARTAVRAWDKNYHDIEKAEAAHSALFEWIHAEKARREQDSEVSA